MLCQLMFLTGFLMLRAELLQLETVSRDVLTFVSKGGRCVVVASEFLVMLSFLSCGWGIVQIVAGAPHPLW